jgi:hypothetical protein
LLQYPLPIIRDVKIDEFDKTQAQKFQPVLTIPLTSLLSYIEMN